MLHSRYVSTYVAANYGEMSTRAADETPSDWKDGLHHGQHQCDSTRACAPSTSGRQFSVSANTAEMYCKCTQYVSFCHPVRLYVLFVFACHILIDMARHGTARHGTARHGTARHDTTRHDTTRHDTTRHDTTRHEIKWYNTYYKTP